MTLALPQKDNADARSGHLLRLRLLHGGAHRCHQQDAVCAGRIGQLGLFREQGVSTTSVMIEEREGSLTLVETTSRGAPAVQHVANKRKARSLTVPHVALEDTILADEVQNVRAFGSENMLEGVQAVVSQRLTEMATKMDATLEHLRVGAIKGQILDADGTAVIYDLFTQFGVTAHTEIDFDLDNATPAPAAA
ncbi:MAG TPA: major capsid protein [Dehalococcoidia bacterium]|nr:major capsid protein [Dehalococcoidia bacterium]